jgi:hypothetical protein
LIAFQNFQYRKAFKKKGSPCEGINQYEVIFFPVCENGSQGLDFLFDEKNFFRVKRFSMAEK